MFYIFTSIQGAVAKSFVSASYFMQDFIEQNKQLLAVSEVLNSLLAISNFNLKQFKTITDLNKNIQYNRIIVKWWAISWSINLLIKGTQHGFPFEEIHMHSVVSCVQDGVTINSLKNWCCVHWFCLSIWFVKLFKNPFMAFETDRNLLKNGTKHILIEHFLSRHKGVISCFPQGLVYWVRFCSFYSLMISCEHWIIQFNCCKLLLSTSISPNCIPLLRRIWRATLCMKVWNRGVISTFPGRGQIFFSMPPDYWKTEKTAIYMLWFDVIHSSLLSFFLFPFFSLFLFFFFSFFLGATFPPSPPK